MGCKYPLDSAVALLPKMQRPNSTGFPSTQPASPQQSNPILTQISSFVTRDISDLIHLIPQLPVKLSSAVNFLQVARRTTEKHLAYIPSLSRNSVALEAAMRCLAESVRWYYLSKSQPPSVESSQDFVSAMRYRMLSLNTQALAHLQSTLNNKKIALSAETILTVQLHCCFEVCCPAFLFMVSPSHLSFLAHHPIIGFSIRRRLLAQTPYPRYGASYRYPWASGYSNRI